MRSLQFQFDDNVPMPTRSRIEQWAKSRWVRGKHYNIDARDQLIIQAELASPAVVHLSASRKGATLLELWIGLDEEPNKAEDREAALRALAGSQDLRFVKTLSELITMRDARHGEVCVVRSTNAVYRFCRSQYWPWLHFPEFVRCPEQGCGWLKEEM